LVRYLTYGTLSKLLVNTNIGIHKSIVIYWNTGFNEVNIVTTKTLGYVVFVSGEISVLIIPWIL